MTIAGHLLRGAAPDGPVTPVVVEGGFAFAIGELRFRYDRHGLHREGGLGADHIADSLSLK